MNKSYRKRELQGNGVNRGNKENFKKTKTPKLISLE